jgi:hypothetical protein
MPETIEVESAAAGSVTIDKRTGWTEPERLTQESFGAPAEPADAGRAAVDQHAEDLRRLADS